MKQVPLLFLTLCFFSWPAHAEKKKPWVATKDSYKTRDPKNVAKERTPANTDDVSKPKPKTNLKSKAAVKKTPKAAPAKEVAQENELPPPPSEEPPPVPGSLAEKTSGAPPPPPAPAPAAPASAPKATVTAELKERLDDETRQYTFRIHSYLGVLINKNSGSVYGISVAIVPEGDSLWYFGPEVSYSKPAAGSIMSVLAGAWRDFPIYGASRLSIGLGALLGPVFADVGTGYASPTYAAFINTALCKEIDELAVVRAEFRPGLIGGRFAFLMNFGVTFRFL